MPLFKKVLKWAVIILVVGYVVLVIGRAIYFYKQDQTDAQVQKIHSTKLQLSDVMGDNLPPDPGAEADKTVAGIDANQNGIRDDVELAIFKEYPNSAKTRAALLQYAMALQMQAIQPTINQSTVIATIQQEDRAFICIGEIISRSNSSFFDKETDKLSKFVEQKQLNTQDRREYRTKFYEKIGSYSSLDPICDINYSTLPN